MTKNQKEELEALLAAIKTLADYLDTGYLDLIVMLYVKDILKNDHFELISNYVKLNKNT